MAIRTGAQIVPVAIEQYGKSFIVNIGANISCSGYELSQKYALTDFLRDAMCTLKWGIIERYSTDNFWNRYEGDTYSHISISTDPALLKMYSFARRTMNNPFNAGLIRESIKAGMFVKKPHINRMAVFELAVMPEQYDELEKQIEYDWSRRETLKFNFLGIIVQMFFARGVTRKNHYFCSQWVSTLLDHCGIDLFHKDPFHVRPFDFTWH